MNAMDAADSRDIATRLGVPSVWVLAAAVPALVATIATQTLFWGLVALIATIAGVTIAGAVRGTTPARERSWFGVPALVVWVATGAAVSGGTPADVTLFSYEAVGLAAVVLGLDALARGKFN